MSRKVSEEMKKAQYLVEKEGFTAYSAAKKVGITHSAIYLADWYKKIRNKRWYKKLNFEWKTRNSKK